MTPARPTERLQTKTPSEVVAATARLLIRPDRAFLHGDRPPMAHADFAEGEAPDRDRESLRAGIARLPRHHGQQHGKRRHLGDRRFEEPHHRRREKRRRQVDLQPGQPLANRIAHGRKRLFFTAGAHHRQQIGGRVRLDRVRELPLPDHAEQPPGGVDHRRHGDILAARELRRRCSRIGRREIGHAYHAHQAPLGINEGDVGGGGASRRGANLT